MTEKSEEEKTEEEAGSKRRWYQYSIRSLMLVTLVIACLLGYISHNARKQRAAVAWVKENGGKVGYDYNHSTNGAMYQQNPPPGPDWLREWIGIDYFSDVVLVDLQGKKTEDISPLQCLTKLKRLNLFGSQLRDISALKEFTELDHLLVSLAKINDLTPLEGLTNLETLGLEGNHVKDIESLRKLKNLKELYLLIPIVRDFSGLYSLKNLKHLRISSTQITDQQVEKLKKALPQCYIVFWDGDELAPDF